jgi:CHASE2 domain-containing sensor protein
LAPKFVIWGLVAIFSVWILLDVLVLQVSSGQTHASFDAMVRRRLHAAAPDPRIVLIDVDEASLQRMAGEFGRWPWPRDTLATVLDYVERQQPAAVVWDIVFSDPDRISPGGDAAFDAAVKRSRHSVFSVVRLPANADAASRLSRQVIPGLWVKEELDSPDAAQPQSTVALVAPALPGVAAASLGYNNGYVDDDGVLRRYRPFERLSDGSSIRSVAMATLAMVDPAAYARALINRPAPGVESDPLIAWRAKGVMYPRVAFADVFAKADGGTALGAVPSFAGKVVLIGSTASSLHDIHPTPLGATEPGVNTLATAIDNALNERHIRELPRWLKALLAIGLCVALGWWVQTRKFALLLPMTFAVPICLLLLSYATLNSSVVFLDLQLSAGLALLFLTLLRFWNQLRRSYWCDLPEEGGGEKSHWAIWALERPEAWSDEPLDRLIDLVAHHAADCRIVAPDLNALPLHPLRWPELARFAAVIGPESSVLQMRDQMQLKLARLHAVSGKISLIRANTSRRDIGNTVCWLWANPDEKSN